MKVRQQCYGTLKFYSLGVSALMMTVMRLTFDYFMKTSCSKHQPLLLVIDN